MNTPLQPLNRPLPLTRPSGTLSPIGGEGWGEGVLRFMVRAIQFQIMFYLNYRLHP